MKYFLINVLLCLLLISCGEGWEVNIDDYTNIGMTQDCGVNSYMLFGDQMFADLNQKYECSINFIFITSEPDRGFSRMNKVNQAVRRLNKDFEKVRISFRVKSISTLTDSVTLKEGIGNYVSHGNRLKKDGTITILVYESTLGRFSGAAGGIPSTFLAIKDFYLGQTTISHEVAHCFGLWHLHKRDETNTKHSLETSDFVCDTPYADFFTNTSSGYLGRVLDDCSYIGPLGNLTQEEHDRNIINIMTYSTLHCRRAWTKEQITRVHWIINNSQDLRNTLKLIT